MLRREYKYLVPLNLIDELRNEFMPYLELDNYSLIRPNKQYTVRSIYFDTHHLDYYHEKLDGLKNRKKIRIRGYNELTDKSIAVLEIKRKIGDFIDKTRSLFFYQDLYELLCSGNIEEFILSKDKLNIEEAKRFFFHVTKNIVIPTSLVVYDREAFFSKFDSNIRITFDKNLRYKSFPKLADLYEDHILKPAMTKVFLLEMKFYRGYPEPFQRIINKFKLKRISYSKYVTCIDTDNSFHIIINNNRYLFSKPVWKGRLYSKEVVL